MNIQAADLMPQIDPACRNEVSAWLTRIALAIAAQTELSAAEAVELIEKTASAA